MRRAYRDRAAYLGDPDFIDIPVERLLDKNYAVHGLYFGNDPRKNWINETYYQLGEPRVYGVSLKYSF